MWGLVGFVVAGIMAGIGVFVVIPAVGWFGWAWTGMAIVIGTVNARRWWQALNS